MQATNRADCAVSQLQPRHVSTWRIAGAVLGRLGLMAGSLVVGAALLELLVRLFAPQLTYRYPQGLFTNDPETHYRLTPGFVGRMDTPEYSTSIRINGAGLRDSREVGPKPQGMRRILVLGDSFAMGHSVEERETFDRLVEDGLDARAGRPAFTVLNSGVPGYSTREELSYLRSRGFALEPDAVVLAFFIGNDIVDNAKVNRDMKVSDGYLTDGDPPPGLLPISVRSFLARDSHLYHLLWPLQRRLRGDADIRADSLSIYANPDDDLWAPTAALLAELQRTVAAHGLPLFVVIIPDRVQVDTTLWKRAAQDRPGVDSLNPNRRLLAIADTLGFLVLDLHPALMRAATREKLYFPIDHHWTRAGNRVAADALTPFLWEHLSKLL